MDYRHLGLILISLALGCSPRGSGGAAGSGAAGNGAAGNGAGAANGGGDAANQSCSPPGTTRTCCGSGTQTCAGVEFPTWGACLAADGTTLPLPALCMAGGANNEPEILVGYAPANGQSVGAGGQVKVWVNDEGAPIIAPGEVVDPTTGAITTPGDRIAKAPDGYLWEPALYIAPQSAENGGKPHFPSFIRGDYNPTTQKGGGLHVAGMEPAPAGSVLAEKFTAEFVWSVDALGLGAGTYVAEFVIHDGDRDRGVGCVTITIQ